MLDPTKIAHSTKHNSHTVPAARAVAHSAACARQTRPPESGRRTCGTAAVRPSRARRRHADRVARARPAARARECADAPRRVRRRAWPRRMRADDERGVRMRQRKKEKKEKVNREKRERDREKEKARDERVRKGEWRCGHM